MSRPNLRRLFGEAVHDALLEQFDRSVIRPGYYRGRCDREGRLVPARIWWRDHEPGNVENKLDRWPLPVLAGEIFGDYCDPVLVWTMRERHPLRVPQRELAAGHTQATWYQYLCEDSAWAREYAPDELVAQPPRRKIDLTKLPPLLPGMS